MLPWALAMVAQAAGRPARQARRLSQRPPRQRLIFWLVDLFGRYPTRSCLGERKRRRTQRSAAVCLDRGRDLRAPRAAHGRVHGTSTTSARIGRLVGLRLRAPQRLAQRVEGPWVRACARHVTALATQDAEALRASGRAFEQIGALLFAAEAMTEAATAFGDDGRASSARSMRHARATLLEHCDGARTH